MELAEYAKKQNWWNRAFGKKDSGPAAEKYSVAKQLVIGGVTGWCAGYLFQKVGKLAASAVGGGFILLQIANHTGYITVDWKRVEKDVNKAKKQLKLSAEKPPKEVRTKAQEVQSFVKKNLVLSGGFAGSKTGHSGTSIFIQLRTALKTWSSIELASYSRFTPSYNWHYWFGFLPL
ncbi:FUN14 domain-containing protein 2 isoform X2 [Anguilla anguilla]|nr:FUN14 domain-containing protein 2 isoform X2 [Anguilla anguilla]